MEIGEKVEDFLRWLEATNKREKHYAVKNTLAAYRRNLERLAKFLRPQGGPVLAESVTRDQVEAYIVSGEGEDGGEVKPQTINQRLAAIRALYKYLRRDRAELADPSAGVRFARIPRSEALHVTGEDGTTLLNHLWERADKKDLRQPLPYRLRDPLLFEILWLTGGRVSEVAGLDVGSVTLGASAIRILYHGKGGKERVIPIPLKAKGQVLKKAWALRDTFDGLLDAARRWAEKHPQGATPGKPAHRSKQ